MSEVYWGIVAGLVSLVAVFFVCMDLVCSNAKGSLPQSGRSGEGSGESTSQTPTRSRHAA